MQNFSTSSGRPPRNSSRRQSELAPERVLQRLRGKKWVVVEVRFLEEFTVLISRKQTVAAVCTGSILLKNSLRVFGGKIVAL
jgi:hypothetical protein